MEISWTIDFFSAAQRNRDFIGNILKRIKRKNGSILEIGSGGGQHWVKFQKHFPDTIWQTRDTEIFDGKSIRSWINYEKLNEKLPQLLNINVNNHPWEIPSNILISLHGIISVNIHIASKGCMESFFKAHGEIN